MFIIKGDRGSKQAFLTSGSFFPWWVAIWAVYLACVSDFSLIVWNLVDGSWVKRCCVPSWWLPLFYLEVFAYSSHNNTTNLSPHKGRLPWKGLIWTFVGSHRNGCEQAAAITHHVAGLFPAMGMIHLLNTQQSLDQQQLTIAAKLKFIMLGGGRHK